MMLCRSSILCVGAILGGLLGAGSVAVAQTNYYETNGIEYSLIGSLPGDQVHADVAIGTSGGYVVWQDNVTDGSGYGVSARRLDATLSGTLSSFRVNQIGTNDQVNARVAMLKDGGAVYVWQGGPISRQHIYAAFQSVGGTFVNSSDIQVSSGVSSFQSFPAVAVLNNSNVVVVYSSLNQVGTHSQYDVFGQILSPTGQKLGGEFLVNQFTNFSQRSASVAPLTSGGFVVTWISEQQRVGAPDLSNPTVTAETAALPSPSVDVYARTYSASGTPVGNEFLVNTDYNPCACASVAGASDGSYLITWAAHDNVNITNGWDIYARAYSAAGVASAVTGVNQYLFGDQLFPRVSALAQDYMVVWTSFGQDGSREGVYAREVHSDGTALASEFLVNTTTAGAQIHPVVASDGNGQFLFVWSTFTGITNSYDLAAQRYINVNALLQPMAAPFVNVPFLFANGSYVPQMVVSWPNLLGLSIANYEVYVNGAGTPAGVVTSNSWVYLTTTGTSNSFQVDYVTADGRRSPLSPAASGKTWSGLSDGGIPYEWMLQYFGSDPSKWPSPNADSDGDGISNLNEFLAGTVPTDPNSALRQQLLTTREGLFLSWNTQPGLTYQVQTTTNFTSWSNFGAARFAAGTTDSVYVGSNPGYYRIVLQR